jgi:hypothetical protein
MEANMTELSRGVICISFLFLIILVSTSSAADNDAVLGQLKSAQEEISSLRGELRGARAEIAELAGRLNIIATRTSILEQKTGPIDVNKDRLEIKMGNAHFHFPPDGNFNIGFANNSVCFAANDTRSRPNENDRKVCFVKP